MLGDGAPRRRPLGLVLAGLALLLLAALVVAASIGAIAIPFSETLRVLVGADGGVDPTHRRILEAIRLPRVAVAAAAGALLALAGALQQGALRNPLAEPATSGTAAGALLGASLTLFAGIGMAHRFEAAPDLGGWTLRILAAAATAWGATLLVVATSQATGRVAPGPLLLAGMAVNALVGAGAALFLFLGSIGQQTAATLVVGWMFGGLLSQASPLAASALLVVAAFAAVGAWMLRRELDQILLGEEEAAAAGVPVGTIRHVALALAALATGAAVAAAGVLAFVGLLAPHLARPLVGPQHGRVAPASVLLGATLLVAADALGRFLAAPAELPAGVVTLLAGAPLLLFLLARTLRRSAA